MEVNKNGIPDASGIYCVYACTYNAITDKVSIRELIYVGESDNIWNRISNHERLADWKKPTRPCVIHLPVLARMTESELRLLLFSIISRRAIRNTGIPFRLTQRR